jgi:hypothetical protein
MTPTASDLKLDPVLQLLMSGRAQTLDEAEELYLDESLPEIVNLVGSDLSDDELLQHPLMVLLRLRCSRGWEDSPL